MKDQLHQALQAQSTDNLSPDLLVMKIKMLERQLNSIEVIFNQHGGGSSNACALSNSNSTASLQNNGGSSETSISKCS
jgi:hypothetical protein